MSGVIAVFKSYPTMGDHALFLGLLSLHSQIFECKCLVQTASRPLEDPTTDSGPSLWFATLCRPALSAGIDVDLCVLHMSVAGIPPSLANRGFGQRQLLLCHYIGVGLGRRDAGPRCHVGLGTRAMGEGATNDSGASPATSSADRRGYIDRHFRKRCRCGANRGGGEPRRNARARRGAETKGCCTSIDGVLLPFPT